jgi:RmuC family
MQSAIIVLIVLFMASCLGLGYWFFVRPVHRLEDLLDVTQTMLAQAQQETATLRQALTRTSGQGQWGEMQLERIVELAGMQQHRDFELQFTLPGGKSSQRPDLVVKLPNGRMIVVDVKAPVDAYFEANAALDDDTRIARLQTYAKNVRDNMGKLANKEYWKLVEPSPTWVVLLIPNEGMFRAALEHDPTLLDTAMQRHVLLASPITLLALLKAMAYGWQQEKRAGNVQQIIEHSQDLHTELRNFVTEWKKLRGELRGTTSAFDRCTTIYQHSIFPVVQLICELDGTGDANEYDLSGMSKLRAPKQVVDLEDVSSREKSKKPWSGKSKSNEETGPQFPDEDEPSQKTVSAPLESGGMLCPACQTPYRENARFCNRCGQSLAETEALQEIEPTTEKDEDYRSLKLSQLRQMKTPEATAERYRRAVEAMMAHNGTVDLPKRWYINVAAVRQLVGGRAPNVQVYLDSRRAEIEAHHRRHRLLPGHNRGKALAITECIAVPDPQPEG